ncbi:MAG: helix-turn-helix transcriptional regulator [Bacillota bacterium]
MGVVNHIKRVREAKGWSQSRLSRETYALFGPAGGITQGAISNWEKGKHEPSLEAALKLCAALQVSIWELFELVLHQDSPAL